MTISSHRQVFQDSLYGAIALDEDLSALAATPVIQRLRHVRLSNIDSVDMPGIANLSRYEHVLGVGYIAGQVGFHSKLSKWDRTVLNASALLHDWAITSFGHLVEEALQYVGTGFDHEERLREIVSGDTPEEIGGIQRQILVGRETGLAKWAGKITRSQTEAERLIQDITDHIRGRGRLGRVISGDIDLDNIDNIFRMAYHMGLPVDRKAPIRLAQAMVDVVGDGESIFRRSAEEDITLWRSTRKSVYEHLMPAGRDFAGKLMILYAAIRAFEAGDIAKLDWNLTDCSFVQRLLDSNTNEVRETVARWIAGEFWDLAPLHWMEGNRPDYTQILSFSRAVSAHVGRTCLAYAIKDKRDRLLTIRFDDGSTKKFGEKTRLWLLGIGSPLRHSFSAMQSKAAFEFAGSFFGTKIAGLAAPATADSQKDAQPWLL